MHLNQAWTYRHLNWISEELDELGLELNFENIPRILEAMKFESRSQRHPERCCNYTDGTGYCHKKIKDLSCLLCACHQYDLSIDEGGCLVKSKFGIFLEGAPTSTGRIWSCEHCGSYHNPSSVRKYLKENLETLRRKMAEAREAVKTDEYKKEIAKLMQL